MLDGIQTGWQPMPPPLGEWVELRNENNPDHWSVCRGFDESFWADHWTHWRFYRAIEDG